MSLDSLNLSPKGKVKGFLLAVLAHVSLFDL